MICKKLSCLPTEERFKQLNEAQEIWILENIEEDAKLESEAINKYRGKKNSESMESGYESEEEFIAAMKERIKNGR